jgi:hypothetical protein
VDWQDGPPGDRMACPACRGSIEVPLDPPPHPIPWEDRRLGAIRRWWRTFDEAAFHPARFFPGIPYTGGQKAPIRFVVFFYLQFFLALAVSIPIGSLLKGRPLLPARLLLFLLIGMPFACGLIVALLYLVSALIHVGLRALGGAGSFEATLRVTAYTHPISLFRFLPKVGRFLYPLWTLACETIGFAAAHRISRWRAFFGALLGLALFLSAVFAAGFLVSLAGFAWPKGTITTGPAR